MHVREWIAGVSFYCLSQENVSEVIKPSGQPSVVICYIYE